MKAMILAAGEGRRMRPLTERVPKPLLQVGGKALIEHQIEKLAREGVRELVVNHGWLGEQIEAALGDGRQLGVNIRYSREGKPLETAGGIIRALPLLGEQPFIVVNADIWTNFPFGALPELDSAQRLAHLVMVDNAEHHPGGDFCLDEAGCVSLQGAAGQRSFTYSGIAVFHPDFFIGQPAGPLPLAPLLRQAIGRGQVSGEYFAGTWLDVGTPARLQTLDKQLRR